MSMFDNKKRWEEWYDDRNLFNQYRKERYVDPAINNPNKQRFLKESRLALFEDALKKTKYGSNEFNAVLEECINIFLELNSDKQLDKIDLINYAKSELLKDKINVLTESNGICLRYADSREIPKKEKVGVFDGRELKQPDDWPYMGRITLRDAIDKKIIGQNPKSKEPEIVKNTFGGRVVQNKNPSPSNTTLRSK